MCSYNKTQVSPYDPTKLAIHSILRSEDDRRSNCGQIFRKIVSFDYIVHFIDEENIATYEDLDCGIAFYPETPKKSDRSIENGNTLPHPEKNPSAFPVTIKITVLLINSITLISFWTRTIYGTWFRQLLCHSNTLIIDTLRPISILNQQLTILGQTHIRCSIHCERWTVKRRDCASALHSFNKITNQMDDWRKQLLRLKSWVISGNSGQSMEFRRLWWTVIVFKCSFLFHLFEFYCFLVQYSFFFRKITFFCSLSLMTVSEK